MDDMGIPLASEKVMGEKRRERDPADEPAKTKLRIDVGKRTADIAEEEGRESRRQRLEHLSGGQCEFDVSEIFSVPRVCLVAKEFGWRSGYSIDIREGDEITGRSWDL